MTASRPAFEASVMTGEEATVVTVSGDVDLQTADRLHEILNLALSDAPAQVHLDLTAVSFMDSTGLNVLVRVRNLAQRWGGQVRITAASKQVQRLLDITGLIQVF